MSQTTIFFLAGDESFTVDFKNSFRGAMYVWNDIAKRYCGFDHFPSFSLDDQMEVWNFANNNPEKMPIHEAIVMASTMDKALLEPDKWIELVEAFEKYSLDHPDSSIGDQAAAIREAMESEKASLIKGIGWRQTSVCGDSLWEVWSEESDDYDAYCPNSSDEHFWIVGQAKDAYKEENLNQTAE